MKRFIPIFFILVMIPAVAYAGVFGKVTGWISGELLALVLTAIIAVLGTVGGVMFGKVNTTFKEAGEFLSVLAEALADKRITKEEITAIVKEGKDVFSLWAKTPEKFKTT